MKNFCILIRGCKIRSIDAASGRITAEVDATTAAKLEALQSTILTKVFKDQSAFFTESAHTFEYVRANFQPLIENKILTLYTKHDRINKLTSEQSWAPLAVGDEVSIGLRLYGLSYQYFKEWTGRSRIQHQVTVLLEGKGCD